MKKTHTYHFKIKKSRKDFLYKIKNDNNIRLNKIFELLLVNYIMKNKEYIDKNIDDEISILSINANKELKNIINIIEKIAINKNVSRNQIINEAIEDFENENELKSLINKKISQNEYQIENDKMEEKKVNAYSFKIKKSRKDFLYKIKNDNNIRLNKIFELLLVNYIMKNKEYIDKNIDDEISILSINANKELIDILKKITINKNVFSKNQIEDEIFEIFDDENKLKLILNKIK